MNNLVAITAIILGTLAICSMLIWLAFTWKSSNDLHLKNPWKEEE